MMNWNIPFSLIAYLLMPILPFIAFLIWCAPLGCPLALPVQVCCCCVVTSSAACIIAA